MAKVIIFDEQELRFRKLPSDKILFYEVGDIFP